MTPEEKNIKHKIDNLSDLDVFFNDSHLWECVEARLDQKKTSKRLFVWCGVAASVLVCLGLYFFLLPANQQQNYAVTKPAAISNTASKPEIITQSKPVIPKVFLRTKKVVEPLIIKDSIVNSVPGQRLLANDITQLNPIDKHSVSSSSRELLQYPIAFKAQRVITLDLPVIPDKMMERESFAKRALRQVKNFNTEGKIDLRELNIEPRNVWAYLERSFFHDTTKITTTKPLKQ